MIPSTPLRQHIINEMGTLASIDPASEITKRRDFIARYLLASGARSLVLGISGGQDSTLAGRLCQLAIDKLNAQHKGSPQYAFYAIRLPYGIQADEEDAQKSLAFIAPTHTLTINIKSSTDATVETVNTALASLPSTELQVSDFNKGNIKARQRMIAQYAIAGQVGGLVVGTDHAAEAITGFYTKHGDGAADLLPLSGLSKRQGAALLKELGAPSSTWEKTPTADLEEDRPALPDEQALGVRYSEIDDYLEGRPIADDIAQHIENMWHKTQHKRNMPATDRDQWWKK